MASEPLAFGPAKLELDQVLALEQFHPRHDQTTIIQALMEKLESSIISAIEYLRAWLIETNLIDPEASFAPQWLFDILSFVSESILFVLAIAIAAICLYIAVELIKRFSSQQIYNLEEDTEGSGSQKSTARRKSRTVLTNEEAALVEKRKLLRKQALTATKMPLATTDRVLAQKNPRSLPWAETFTAIVRIFEKVCFAGKDLSAQDRKSLEDLT